MQIRKAGPEDCDAMLRIYAQARAFMAQSGNPEQWGDFYPPADLVRRDIAEGRSYVCVDRGEIVAVFFFAPGPDATYLVIENGSWLDDEPYHVIHRIASAGGRKGAASFCLSWCFAQSGNIRIDTHRDNVPMHSLLNKNGFRYCGIIHLENGDERLAYQRAGQA
jgi:RimJ/RimL family protein N-acetyltransferase